MRENFFMQLILVLALLLLSGGNGNNSQPVSSSEMVELLKYAAGGAERANEMIREVEQVSSVLEAIAPIAQAFSAKPTEEKAQQSATEEVFADGNNVQGGAALILKPIANIADDGIYNALARAVEQ